MKSWGGKTAFLGGISDPGHLHHGTSEQVRQAVREAFEVFSHRGFALGWSAAILPCFPWENAQAMMDHWRRSR